MFVGCCCCYGGGWNANTRAKRTTVFVWPSAFIDLHLWWACASTTRPNSPIFIKFIVYHINAARARARIHKLLFPKASQSTKIWLDLYAIHKSMHTCALIVSKSVLISLWIRFFCVCCSIFVGWSPLTCHAFHTQLWYKKWKKKRTKPHVCSLNSLHKVIKF